MSTELRDCNPRVSYLAKPDLFTMDRRTPMVDQMIFVRDQLLNVNVLKVKSYPSCSNVM